MGKEKDKYLKRIYGDDYQKEVPYKTDKEWFFALKNVPALIKMIKKDW
jgi:hypothetical protein